MIVETCAVKDYVPEVGDELFFDVEGEPVRCVILVVEDKTAKIQYDKFSHPVWVEKMYDPGEEETQIKYIRLTEPYGPYIPKDILLAKEVFG